MYCKIENTAIKSLIMRKTFFLIFLLCRFYAAAQFNMQPPSFQSPEVASLINEVQTPVSHSSGTLSVSIPVYTVRHGDIEIPITLEYDASGVKVNSLPGWVGQNWNLKAGGAISRIVKGLPDENYESWSGFTYPNGYFFNRQHLNTPDWETYARLKSLATKFDPDPRKHVGDLEPDEFIFNFCGHQGKFYMDSDGVWQVKGGGGYKIEHAVLSNYAQDWYAPNDYTFHELGSLGRYIQLSTRPIGGFKISAPDGTVFYFGMFERIGKNFPSPPVNPTTQPDLGWESVEITADFFSQLYCETINTWHLIKIVSPRGAQVDFEYERGPERVAFSEILFYNEIKRKKKNPWSWHGGGSTFGHMTNGISHTGMVIFPSYLSRIITDNEEIIFSRSVTENLKYEYSKITSLLSTWYRTPYHVGFPKNGNDWEHRYHNGEYFGTNSPYLKLDNYIARINHEKFKDTQLDAITCRSRFYGHERPHTKFTFRYTADSRKRLQLKSFKKNEDNSYIFFYNTLSLPDYLSDKVDHWGYYNNKTRRINFEDPASLGVGYYESRNPDFKYTVAESLEKIVFPTGGYRKFIYEPHIYTTCISRDRTTGNLLFRSSRSAGSGLRIKEVIDNFGNRITKKQYSYEDGILNGEPVYYWPDYSGKTIFGDSYTAVRFFSMSVVPVSSNPAGGAVSYSKVCEKIPGKGKTVYTYSNHDGFPDEKSVGIDHYATNYSPLSGREILRGKLLEARMYEEGKSRPVKTETYDYLIPGNNAKYIKSMYIRRMNVLNSASKIPIDVVDGWAYRIYIHPYNKVKKTECLYVSGTDDKITTTSKWTYGPYNLLTSYSHGIAGSMEEVRYYYPFDFGASGIYKSMLESHMLSALIRRVESYNRTETSRDEIEYGQSREITHEKILPVVSKRSYDQGKNWEKTMQVTAYDIMGNPVEIKRDDGRTAVYIWGYAGQHIVAEIKNTTLKTVKEKCPELGNMKDIPLPGELPSGIEKSLRSIPNAPVTTWKYIPFVGCIQMTDASGRSTGYSYDSSGRLAAIYDTEGHVLKTFEYNMGY